MPLDFLKFRSLQARVTLLTLTMFILGMAALGAYSSHILRHNIRQLAADQQFATASILADEVAQELDFRLQALKTVASAITPSQMADASYLQQLLVQRPVLQNFFTGGTLVIGMDGIAKASFPLSSGRIGLNYMDRECVIAALKEGRPCVGTPVLGRARKAPVLPLAVPIADGTGTVRGVLAGIVNLGAPNFLDTIANNTYGKQGGYFIVSTKHRMIITATDKSRIMEPLPPPGVSAAIDKLMAGHEGSFMLTDQLGVQMLNAGKRIHGTDWDMVVSLPLHETFAPLSAIQQQVVFAAVLFSLLAGGLTWWLLRRQLLPAFDTIKALGTLADTDQLPTALPVARHDEIGKLIAGFNKLLETLRLQATALRVSDQALKDISQAVVITDRNQNIISSNEAHVAITGYSQEEIVGLNCRFLQGPKTDAMAIDAIRLALKNDAPFSGEILNYRKDGTPFWNDLSISPMRDANGAVTHFVGVTRDVTERKTTEGNVRQLAFYDTLTNLPNRRLLTDRLTQAMAVSKRTEFYGAVMFLDLDNFKQLNDTQGHVAGDLLLIEVSNRLKNCVREVDTLARFGGDEFVVILSELDSDKVESAGQAATIAEKIRTAVSHPYHLTIKHPGQADTAVEHYCTASIGVALFLNHEASQDDLLKWADTAMYQAKAAGRNVVRFYGPSV